MFSVRVFGYNLCTVFLMLHILPKGIIGYQLSGISVCKDVYIWMADGSVDCNYLMQPSSHGVHARAKYFCTEYPLTRCCKTCAVLKEFNYTTNERYKQTTEVTTQNEVLTSTSGPESMAPLPTSYPNTIQVSFFKIPLPKGSLTSGDLARKFLLSSLLGNQIKSNNIKQGVEVNEHFTTNSQNQKETKLVESQNPGYETSTTFKTVTSTTSPTQIKVVLMDTNNLQRGSEDTSINKSVSEKNASHNLQDQNTGRLPNDVITQRVVAQLLRQLVRLQKGDSSPGLIRFRNYVNTASSNKQSTVSLTSRQNSTDAPIVEPTSSTVATSATNPADIQTSTATSFTSKLSQPIDPYVEHAENPITLPSISTETVPTPTSGLAAWYQTTTATTVPDKILQNNLSGQFVTEPSKPVLGSSGALRSGLVESILSTSTSAPAVTETTERQTAEQRKDLSGRVCKDVGIWLGSGSLECSALEDERRGLKQHQLFFCNRYPLTSCCETCKRITVNQVQRPVAANT